MIAPYWAAPIACAAIAIGDFVNRRVVGWLPDDPPKPGRKTHARPIPLAGVLLCPVILAWCIADRAWLPLAAIVIAAATGFEDDRRKEYAGPLDDGGLDWRIKAAGLLVAAGLVAWSAIDPVQEPWQFAFALGLTFVLTNAVNFLDNTDGVATGLAGSSLLCLGLGTGNPTWVAAAGFAAVGFLPWNWPRPRVFLGDAGAYTLGLGCSHAIVQVVHLDPLLLLAVAVPLVDFVQVVTARIVLAHPPWVGDRRHLTHIAQNLGLPKTWCAPLFTLVAAGLALWAVASANT